MDFVKEAFQKVKQDIDALKMNLEESNREMIRLHEEIKIINENLEKLLNSPQISNPTHSDENSAFQQINPTNQHKIQHIINPFKPLNTKNNNISIGNEGVPTDRQTDQQTDRFYTNMLKIPQNNDFSLKNASELLNSLDSLKKEIRLKFKMLTDQEMAVFSAIYQIEEDFGFSDYKSISRKLNLTESSIRDYVGRLMKKGIPVDKIKVNNKTIHLSISKNLKNLASLSTILQLREL